jgi:hypothetical protein
MDDADTTITMREVDSLLANEFVLEIDGKTTSGVFSVSGLVTDFQEAGGAHPVVIAKMVQRDPNAPFNAWLRQTIAAKEQGGEFPTRTVTVVAIDDGTEIRRWHLHNARIIRVSYSDFDSASALMIEERITVECRKIEQTWSLK